jgi:PhzF family phenazine biosynthesis protein
MRPLDFKKMDAFATGSSTGNPAGCIALRSQSDLSLDEKQRIGRELKGFVSEVGFISRIARKRYELRYFSSEMEVDFCGHATIAIMYDLFKTRRELRGVASVTIVTNRGELSVLNRLREDDSVFIMAPEPIYKENRLERGTIAGALGIDEGDLGAESPISVIDAGLTTLLVPIARLEVILGIEPDMNALKEFCLRSDVDIVELFSPEVASPASDYRVRVFAPKFGYLEDPATGSGNSAFGYYLIENGLWADRDRITIEQNAEREAYNVVRLVRREDTSHGTRLYFGGNCITRIEGKYLLG